MEDTVSDTTEEHLQLTGVIQEHQVYILVSMQKVEQVLKLGVIQVNILTYVTANGNE